MLARIALVSGLLALASCATPDDNSVWVHPDGPADLTQAETVCTYQVDSAAPVTTNYLGDVADNVMAHMDQNAHRQQLAAECMAVAGWHKVYYGRS